MSDAPDLPSPPRSRLQRLLPLLLFAAVVAAVWASGLTRYVTLDNLRQHSQQLKAFADEHFWLALFGYIGGYVLLVMFSIPGALIMTLAGGMLFGAALGSVAAVLGCTGGSFVVFLVARTAIGDSLRRRAGPTLTRLIQGFQRNAASYLLTLRLMPGVPIFMVNAAAGIVHMRASTFVAVSIAGMLPSSLVYASFGSTLVNVFARGETPDLGLVLEPNVYGPMLGLAALSCLPLLYQWLRRRVRGA